MEARNRFLPLAIVVGLALVVPYFLQKKPEQAHTPAAGKPAAAASAGKQGAAGGTSTPNAAPPLDEAARRAAERVGTIDTASYQARVTNLGGGLTQFALKGERLRKDGKPLDMVTT